MSSLLSGTFTTSLAVAMSLVFNKFVVRRRHSLALSCLSYKNSLRSSKQLKFQTIMKTFCLVGYYCAGCVKIEPEGDDQDGEQPAAGLQADTERGQPARSQAGGR